MIDVFISYSNPDRAKAELLVKKLSAVGMSVWWDGELSAAENFDVAIREQASNSKALVTLWSPHSVHSAWVLTEADIARRLNRLVPAIIEPVALPLGFTAIQAADLTTWNGQDGHPGFDALVRSLRRLKGEFQSDTAKAEDPGQRVEVAPRRPFARPKGANKTSVFIAHATDDKPKLRGAIEVLLDVGFQLWIDKPQRIGLKPEIEARIRHNRIRYGEDWKEGIRKAIGQSDVVLAFWSMRALAQKREQFHYELYQGLIQQKLKQCRLDEASYDRIGTPYSFEQLADLSDFRGTEYHSELDVLIEDMAQSRRKRGWFV